MEKLRECTLNNEDLLDKCEKWIYKLCESGGHAWTLSIPVALNEDPDVLFSELIKRFQKEIDIPKHETVEQWEERTGQTYPDDGPVWYSDKITDGYELVKYAPTKFMSDIFKDTDISIIVANHHGKPDSEGGR